MRLNFYEGHEVFDEYFTYDGQPIYWNASIAETECGPYIYAYLYYELPDGGDVRMGYFYEHFTTECEDWGDVDLHVHNMTYTRKETNNGTTDMIWNLSDLEVGEEYLFEWFTYRSSSYTASGEDSCVGSTTIAPHSRRHPTTPTSTGPGNPGSWCDLDVNGHLYAEFDTSQEWWDEVSPTMRSGPRCKAAGTILTRPATERRLLLMTQLHSCS